MTERELQEKAREHWLRRQGRFNYAFVRDAQSTLRADEPDQYELRDKLTGTGIRMSYDTAPLDTQYLLHT